MTLPAGARLGPYEILSPLGAGGMGEVYKARDTRLERTVALKVLPSHLSQSVESRQRFEREARTISSLTHPHICALYDIGRENDTDYLVMEYLEGETLASRLVKGALPLEGVLRCGIEIADALDKAHRQGVVHRDLKPGNIMLTKAGVKLLDFGLAKALAPENSSVTMLTALPTEAAVTKEGTILGTLQYMAPEQLEAKQADARTDIFALGCVLYEMTTGKKPFSGASQASLISAIMSSEPPPLTTLQSVTPPALDRVVKTCLVKDPDERWQTAHDVKLQLKWIAEGGSQVVPPTLLGARPARREGLAWALAAAFLLLALGSLAVSLRRSPGASQTVRAFIPAPEGTVFNFRSGSAGPVAISPDGRRLAFAASTLEGEPFLWVRRLDAPSAIRLAGTQGASYPFWSPDSRFLGFFAEGKLKTIEASGSGGPPQALADILEGRGGTWNRDGVIVFGPSSSDRLYRVSVTGGEAVPVTALDESVQERHRWPYFLPDGRHFLYLARFSQPERNAIYAGSLDSREKKLILRADSSIAYALPGYILFRREEKLLAAPFDAERLAVTGEPLTVAEGIELMFPTGSGNFTASENGVLAYGQDPDELAQLQWFDRTGKQTGSVGGVGEYQTPRLSFDGKRLAVTLIGRPGRSVPDIWLYDLPRTTATRFTYAETLADFNPTWSPDGGQIVFSCNPKGPFDLHQKAVGGSGKSVALLESKKNKFSSDWSSDGRFILYREFDPKSKGDLWILSLFGDRKPIPLLTTEFDEGGGQFSPDLRWVAYTSNESGRYEVYVISFPEGKDRQQVSTTGGSQPRWRRDGQELFYIAADQKLMAVEVRGTGPGFMTDEPKPLFESRGRWRGGPGLDLPGNYDVAPDGQRFLINMDATGGASSPIALVLNWAAGLKK